MTKRTYGQYCAVARGLDIIGDRWTLLIVRDLLLGPKRYKDLLSGQPGIGTNLLAARLREMEAAGLVERATLPPPAGSAVYRLTRTGAALEPVLVAIAQWGGQFLGAPLPSDTMVPRAYFVAIRHAFRPELAGDLSETYELHVGGNVFEVRVAGGQCTTRESAASDPDAVLDLDAGTLNALLMEGLPPPGRDRQRASSPRRRSRLPRPLRPPVRDPPASAARAAAVKRRSDDHRIAPLTPSC